MKKLLSILLICFYCVGLAGCGSGVGPSEEPLTQTEIGQQVSDGPDGQDDTVPPGDDRPDEKLEDSGEATSQEPAAPDDDTAPEETAQPIENAGQPVGEPGENATQPDQAETGLPDGDEPTKPEENPPADEDHQNGTSVTTPAAEETEGELVWVPTNGGTKYHSKPGCSNMKNPMQVSVETAVANGYEPCKKCYK